MNCLILCNQDDRELLIKKFINRNYNQTIHFTFIKTLEDISAGVFMILFTLLHFPNWIVNLVFYGLFLGAIFIDYKKTRCPYCHSMRVMGLLHAKGSQEICPSCRRLIYYD